MSKLESPCMIKVELRVEIGEFLTVTLTVVSLLIAHDPILQMNDLLYEILMMPKVMNEKLKPSF